MADYKPFEIDLNLEDVPEWSGEQRPLLPVGTYHFQVVNVSNEGKYIAVEFKVVDGPNADERAWNNYMTGTKPGQARLKNLMIACGASLQRFNSDELLGVKLYADVIHQPGKAQVNDMGEPLPLKMFANVQNERRELAEGEVADGGIGSDDGAGDLEPATPEPEPPPITRSDAPKPAPAASAGQAKPATRTRRA
jgi:hypothetical protein